MKLCARCQIEKPAADFYMDRRRGQRRAHCKACHNAGSKRWAQANREKRRASSRRWRATPANADAAREATRRWQRDNPSYPQAWREANPERVKAASDRFRTNHPEYVRRWNRHNHDRRRGAQPTAAAREYVTVIRGDPCSYCDERAESVDHIVPVTGGGMGDWENLTGACQHCNSTKREASLLGFLIERGR